MSNELKCQDQTGVTVYAVVYNGAGQVWNVAGGSANTFTTPASASWANYVVSMAEQGTAGFYLGNFPTGINAAGQYWIYVYEEQGGSAAVSDNLIQNGTRILLWSGTAEVAPIPTIVAAAIMATVVEPLGATNQTVEQALRDILALLAGKVENNTPGAGQATWMRGDGTTPALVGTYDSSGDRTAVTWSNP